MENKLQMYTEQFKFGVTVRIKDGFYIGRVITQLIKGFNLEGMETNLTIKSSSKTETSATFFLEFAMKTCPEARKSTEELHDWYFTRIPNHIGSRLESVESSERKVVLGYVIDTLELGIIDGYFSDYKNDEHQEAKQKFLKDGCSESDAEMFANAHMLKSNTGEI